MNIDGEGEYYLPSMTSEFTLSPIDDKGIREFVYSLNPTRSAPQISSLIEDNEFNSRVNNPRFSPAILCGLNIFKSGIHRSNSSMTLPKAMRPKRLRVMNRLFIAFFSVSIVLLFSIAIRVYLGNSSRMNALIQEQNHIDNRMTKLDSNIKRNKKVDNSIALLNMEYLGEPNILKYLDVITRILPNDMRLTSFSLRNGEIDLNITGNSNTSFIIQELNSNPLFDVLSVDKLRSKRAMNVSVKLRIVKNDK